MSGVDPCMEFTVVDCETTGLFPARSDRIVEIAVVRVNWMGEITDEYTTLVNPERDMGPTHLHGLRAADVKDAPVFADIVGDIVQRLAGAVFVAHNVHFDKRFVEAELRRAHYDVPTLSCLCTMEMATRIDPTTPGRKLEVVCKHFGVTCLAQHCAYHDAVATANVLSKCLRIISKVGRPSLRECGIDSQPASRELWPRWNPSAKSCPRRATTTSCLASPLTTLISRLPSIGCKDARANEYLATLDRALEDRRITPGESEELLAIASELGLSREQVEDAHWHYLDGLVQQALADGIISEFEASDLETAKAILSISDEEYARIRTLAEAAMAPRTAAPPDQRKDNDGLTGKSVCFTGQLLATINGEFVSREMAEQLAASHGMVVRNTVTKKLDFLVTSDPDSMSGKAKKARSYGIRVLAEPVFWSLLGVRIDQ
jgi:DNA polymerase III subunit epsilon